jgi:hypothetical protein
MLLKLPGFGKILGKIGGVFREWLGEMGCGPAGDRVPAGVSGVGTNFETNLVIN